MRWFEPRDEPKALPEVKGMPVDKDLCLVFGFIVA